MGPGKASHKHAQRLLDEAVATLPHSQARTHSQSLLAHVAAEAAHAGKSGANRTIAELITKHHPSYGYDMLAADSGTFGTLSFELKITGIDKIMVRVRDAFKKFLVPGSCRSDGVETVWVVGSRVE
jgi:hypothetical protein